MFATVVGGCCRQLDTSVGVSGPHDFAVRARLRQRLRRGLRQSAEALAKAEAARTSLAPPASTASRPALMTCATPLFRDGTARVVDLICPTGKAKYFFKRSLTRVSENNPTGKSVRLLSLSPCGRGWRDANGVSVVTGEGFLSADADPSSGADVVRATFSHKGRREKRVYAARAVLLNSSAAIFRSSTKRSYSRTLASSSGSRSR